MNEGLDKKLEGTTKEIYGVNYNDHLLQQYKLYVEMADKISGRRQTANTFFLTINTSLVALLAALLPGTSVLLTAVWYVIIGVVGLLLSFSWFQLLGSYRKLNAAKFNVIHEIEKGLPIRPYDAEWTRVGTGKDKNSYLPFTYIETKVPLIFGVIYIALIVIALIRGF